MKNARARLGDLLIQAGLLNEEKLNQALAGKKQGQKLGDVLIEKGYITQQQLIEVLEFQLGIPHVNLYRMSFDPDVVRLIPKDFAQRNILIPMRKDGDRLFVAMADPMDFSAIEDVRLMTGMHVETAIAGKDDILKAINKYYAMDDSLERMLNQVPDFALLEDEQVASKDAPIVKMVNQLLTNAIQGHASDIHIDPHQDKVVIRFRVDGFLHTERILPKNTQSVLTARVKIMANMDITESRVPQDGRIKTVIEHRPIDLRISTLPTVFGEKIVMRILDMNHSIHDLESIGFNKVHLKKFQHMIDQPTGIVLVTGPTGSGKSTTLYGALNYLNTEEVNIITIEDPVEHQIEGVNQIQVNNQVGMTFATGLRSILRQDPNIIMVGEIRDKETAEIAIRASLTGHLVLSTLHTNDALSAAIRLVDMGIEPFLVATALSGIVSQRLVRKVCRDCGQAHQPTQSEQEIFRKRGIKIETIIRGEGCGSCNMTGYKGRVAIHELIVVDEEMRRMIMNNASIDALRDHATKQDVIFLIDDGLIKVKQGMTTTEEVLRVTLGE